MTPVSLSSHSYLSLAVSSSSFLHITSVVAPIFLANVSTSFISLANKKVEKVVQAGSFLAISGLSILASHRYLGANLIETIIGISLNYLGQGLVNLINLDEEDSKGVSSGSSKGESAPSVSKSSSIKPKKADMKRKPLPKRDTSRPVKLKEAYEDEMSLYQGILKNHQGMWFGVPASNDEGGIDSMIEHMQLFKDFGVKKIYIQCSSDDHCKEVSEMIEGREVDNEGFLDGLIQAATDEGIKLETIEYRNGDVKLKDEKYIIFAPIPTQDFVKVIQKQNIMPIAHRLKIPSVYVHSDFRMLATEVQTNVVRKPEATEETEGQAMPTGPQPGAVQLNVSATVVLCQNKNIIRFAKKWSVR